MAKKKAQPVGELPVGHAEVLPTPYETDPAQIRAAHEAMADDFPYTITFSEPVPARPAYEFMALEVFGGDMNRALTDLAIHGLDGWQVKTRVGNYLVLERRVS